MLDIVIPVYRAKDTLPDLFECLKLQTKKMFLVNVVQDGDEEDYSEIIHKYAQILHINWMNLPTNGGPGNARQYGLDNMCQGDYVAFIDADDLVSPRFVESLYTTAKRTDADMIVSDIVHEQAHVGANIIKAQDNGTWMHGRIYKREFLTQNNIRFWPNVRCNEDSSFNLLCAKLAKNIMSLDEQLYIWRDNTNSITRNNLSEYNTKYTPDFIIGNIQTCLRLIKEEKLTVQNIGYYIAIFYNASQEEIIFKSTRPDYEDVWLRMFFESPLVMKVIDVFSNFKYILRSIHCYTSVNKKNYFYPESLKDWLSKYIELPNHLKDIN